MNQKLFEGEHRGTSEVDVKTGLKEMSVYIRRNFDLRANAKG